MTRQPRCFFYKLTCDDGGAPCVEGGLLSLAICKPILRQNAQAGDWIFGFAANSVDPGNRLLYIAEVSEVVPGRQYYSDGRYSQRPDCIYTWRAGRYAFRRGARFHGADHLARDLGNPPSFDRAVVLLSRNFRYFGRTEAADYKARYPALARAVRQLGQGYRVHHSPQLSDELNWFRHETWRGHPPRKVLVPSTHAPRPGRSHRGGGCGVVSRTAREC
jgi:hypothetical protein